MLRLPTHVDIAVNTTLSGIIFESYLHERKLQNCNRVVDEPEVNFLEVS